MYCGDGIKSWHTHQNNSSTAANTSTNNSAARGDGSTSGTVINVIASDSIDNHAPLEPFSTQPTNTTNKLGYFQRYRVNHDYIHEPTRYFDLTTLFNGTDPTGGGDPIPTIGQFDHGNNASFKSKLDEKKIINSNATANSNDNINGKSTSSSSSSGTAQPSSPIWLRFEPFILHVMCHSLKSASILMAAARPAFKNVGLTSWHCDDITDDDDGVDVADYGDDDRGSNYSMMDDDVHSYNNTNSHNHQQQQQQQKNQCKKGKCPRYLVAIWGDEGLDMPLSLPTSPSRGLYYHPDTSTADNPDDSSSSSKNSNAEWLASLVNERHARNWKKIERFVESMKSLEGKMHSVDDDVDDEEEVATGLDGLELDTANDDNDTSTGKASGRTIPRSYDGKQRYCCMLTMTV